MRTTNSRKLRATQLLAHNKVEQINDFTFRVHSQTDNGSYIVARKGLNYVCQCADFEYNHAVCKHIYAVEQYSKRLKRAIPFQVERSDNLCEPELVCQHCGSENIIKRGCRKTKNGKVQRFYCNSCRKYFVMNHGFEKMKATPQVVTVSLDLFFKGISLRKIVDHLKQFYGVKVTHVAVLKWIKKYVKIMKAYVDSLVPDVSGIWHSDEMTLSTKHEGMKWLWNVMCNETRFWLASQITEKRETKDARMVLAEARNVAKIKPLAVVTDGLRSYEHAITKEFHTMKLPRTEHIRVPNIRNRSNNNMVERLNGTIRERNKVMRGLDKEKTAQAIIDGFRIYYNFIRPHSALNEKTPAEKCGTLKLQQNKWRNLIEKATQRF